MVRLDEPVSHGEAIVMLDHRAAAHRGAGVGSSLETAVTLAASISEHLLAADHQIRLTTHDGSVLCRGRDITDDVLAQLAVVEPDRTSTMAPGAIAGSGLIVAILGDLDPGSARTLVAARRRNTNAVAFVLHAAEWARPQGPATSTAVSGTSSRGTTTNGGAGNGTTGHQRHGSRHHGRRRAAAHGRVAGGGRARGRRPRRRLGPRLLGLGRLPARRRPRRSAASCRGVAR